MTEEIYKLLDERRLDEGIDSLSDAAARLDDWQLRSRVETLETNYMYMLKYIRMGVQDPNMQELYNRMLGEAYLCADRCAYILHSRKYPELYKPFVERRRTVKEILEEIEETVGETDLIYEEGDKYGMTREEQLAEFRHAEGLMDEMFDSICFSTEWTKEEYDAAYKFIQGFVIDDMLTMMVAALTINLIHYFDPMKLAILITIATTEDADEKPTYCAVASFAIVALIHDKRIQIHKSFLKQALHELKTSINLNNNRDKAQDIGNLLLVTQDMLVTCINTDKIVKKINDEVLPGMMQTIMTDPARIQRMLNGTESDEDEDMAHKDREEWQKKADKVNEKMQELVNMHTRGADTYYSTFRHLKGHRFFRHPAHWFFNYKNWHPDAEGILAKHKPAKGSILYEVLDSQSFCSSDKFSFVLTLESLPPNQLHILLNSSNKNMSVTGFPEVFIWENKDRSPKAYIRDYLQCMYRFFKLWRPNCMTDPFKMKLKPYNCQTLKPWLDTPEAILRLGVTYHFWECWKEGAETFDVLGRRYKDYGLDLESNKIAGYCHEMNGDPLIAVLYYGRAAQHSKDDLWILKRELAIQLRLEQYNWVLDTFEKIIRLEPDNMDTIYSMGMTLIRMNKYQEALNAFYKIDYIKGYSARVTRGIGWCYLMTADFDKAEGCFQKIVGSGQDNASDLMNLGHAHYFRYNLEEAYRWYKASYRKLENKKKFVKAFTQDMWAFANVAGYEVVDPMLNSLILDALRSDGQD